jgi:hypothetical protein
MLRRTAQLLTIFLVVPVPALAADLTFSLGGGAEYDSNVLRRTDDIEDDVFFRIRPGIEVHEDRGQDVNFSLGYQFPVEFAVDHGKELNDYDHLANGDITYHVNDRLDLFASEDFRYLRSILSQEFDMSGTLSGAGVPLVDTNRDRVTMNTAELGASYRFTPRLSGTARAEHRYFDTTREDRQQSWALSAVGDLNYVLTSQHTVGMGVRYIRQDFEETRELAPSVSDTYNGYLSWRYQATENTVFSVSAGPSYIQVDSETPPPISGVTPIIKFTDGINEFVFLLSSCPFLPGSTTERYIPTSGCGFLSAPLTATEILNVNNANSNKIKISNDNLGGGTTDDLTAFGNLTLSQRWTPNLASALRYDRSQGTASGLGGTVTRDAVSLSTTWDFAERWQLAVRGDWTHRKSVADAAQIFYKAEDAATSVDVGGGDAAQFSPKATTAAIGTNSIDTNRWGVAGRVTHRVWRNTRIFLQLAYNEQTSEESSRGSPSDFDNFLATFEIRHVFEPIKLW